MIFHRFNCLLVGLLVTIVLSGCQRRSRDESEQIIQQMNSRTLKTDALRQGIRYLSQINPSSKDNFSKEIVVLLNTWLQSASSEGITFTSSQLLNALDPKVLEQVGCQSADILQFSPQDIDHLYQCWIMRQLSQWIVDNPVRDRLFQPVLEAKFAELPEDEARKLERAYKLFDWTIRNIRLVANESSQSTVRTLDSRVPLVDGMVGITNLPWQTALFCSGDFVERGRVFTSLAAQQGIDVCWVSVGADPGEPGQLFAIGVLAGKELLLLEPKLGIPIVDPDTNGWSTLQEASSNERVTRRLSLPQYQYAFDKDSIRSVQLLVDAVPFAASRRARVLESALTGDERMSVSVDLDAVAERLSRAVPNSTVSMWHTPVLAQLYSQVIADRLSQITDFTMRYMSENAIWLLENSIREGRLLHLDGKFERTMDSMGALKTYMETRVDDESLKKLTYNPDVQKALGLFRGDSESKEQFDMRILQAQSLFNRAKFDASFLLAQLHFDRGDYNSSVYWLKERVLNDPRSQRWHATGWYVLARGLIELERFDEAEEALIKPAIEDNSQVPGYVINPQDAGNRLRLRMLRRIREQADQGDGS